MRSTKYLVPSRIEDSCLACSLFHAFTFGTARSTHALYQREGTTASPSDYECMYVCTPHTCHVVLYECESWTTLRFLPVPGHDILVTHTYHVPHTNSTFILYTRKTHLLYDVKVFLYVLWDVWCRSNVGKVCVHVPKPKVCLKSWEWELVYFPSGIFHFPLFIFFCIWSSFGTLNCS